MDAISGPRFLDGTDPGTDPGTGELRMGFGYAVFVVLISHIVSQGTEGEWLCHVLIAWRQFDRQLLRADLFWELPWSVFVVRRTAGDQP